MTSSWRDNLESVIRLERWLLENWRDPQLRQWSCSGQQVWPFLCHAMNTLAIDHLVLDRWTLPSSFGGRMALAAYAQFGERVMQRQGWARADHGEPLWPDNMGVFVATISAIDPMTGMTLTTDAMRLALQSKGVATCSLLVDAGPDHPAIGANPLGGMIAIGDRLSGLRRAHGQDPSLLEGMPGFVEWTRQAAQLLRLPQASLRRWLQRLLAHFSGYLAQFRRMISESRPPFIVLTDYGDAFTVALVAAAREADIPVFCIQHGVLRRTDPEFPTHPFRTHAAHTLPEHHLVWRLDNLGPGDIPVGPPSLNLMLGMGGDAGLPKPPAKDPGDDIVILAAPQVVGDIQPIADFVVGLKRPVRCRWRLHPRLASARRLWQSAHSALLQAGVKSSELDMQPLAVSLLQADLVVTAYSAVALEAQALGIKTRFVSPYAKWILADQVDTELASFSDEPMLDVIRSTETPAARAQRYRERFGPGFLRAAELLAATAGRSHQAGNRPAMEVTS